MKENNKNKNVKYLVLMLLCIVSLTTIFVVMTSSLKGNAFVTNEIETYRYYSNNKNEDVTYLSDIDYIAAQSFTRWDQIRYNEINGGGKITVKIENNAFSFDKGIWAHATSQVTYDISEYNYKYFTTFIGINTSSNAGNGVKYTIYTSQDGSKWDAKTEEILKQPGENATFIKVNIQGAKYLRLIATDNGSNGNDHSVYADAKLVNDIDESSSFPSVEEYNNIIKSKYTNQQDITGEYEFTLLKRELVKNVGQFTLNSFYNASPENKAVIDWLMGDQKALRYYILGGAPNGGSYYNSLSVLSRLYYNYKEDFNKNKNLNNKWEPSVTDGDVYLKMATSIALTHSETVGLWMWSTPKENQSDPVRRYAIYKYLYDNDGFKANDNTDMTPWFESLKVEEMRFVVQNMLDDEEILWLNSYVKTRISANNGNVGSLLTPHPYIEYVWPNYTQDLYYTNDDYFNELFAVNKTSNNIGKELVDADGTATGKIGLWDSEFVIPGNKEVSEYKIKISKGSTSYRLTKVWMNFRNKFGTGAVCGGISKSGSNIRNVFSIPASVIGQPGHAALLYYSKDAQGRGYWGIDNDVSGWTESEKGERMLLGWGNASYTKGSYQVVYMVLAQEAINDYDNLLKAEEKLMLARTYSNDKAKQEELIREALKIQPINIDAWYDLINIYNNSDNKSEDDFYNLAEELAENLKYYPLPMYQLTNLIKPKLTSVENSYKFALLQGRMLKEASETPNNTTENYYVYQPSVTRTEANYLLGKVDTSIASFSFDGEDAGKIVLSSRFDGNGVRWDYSLDGKNTWKEVSFTGEEPHKLQLTKEQIASITSENDIFVHIVGVNYDEENLYQIDITEGTLLSTLFANDLENKVLGVNSNTEWRYNESFPWTSYNENNPDLTGNKTIQVRQGANGTKLASDSVVYTFTMDNQPNTRKYIPVSNLTIHSASTQATNNAGAATNAIDGNYNTRYHSAWDGTDTERYIVIKLGKPVNLSAVEFVPCGGGNGKIYDGTIYGSMDGENWEELVSLKNITYSNAADTIAQAIDNTKSFEIADPREVQYVKIVADRTNGNWFTARAFNLYQDITEKPEPQAEITYSTTNVTNGQVVAKIVNPSTKITIINNGGKDTYTFLENGVFTFEFVDENGVKGTSVSKVDWIDKKAPTASIKYEKQANKKVVATLVNESETIIITNNNANREYTFTENGEFIFEFEDLAGNKGTAKAIVDYLQKETNTYKPSPSTGTPSKEESITDENNTIKNEELADITEENIEDESDNKGQIEQTAQNPSEDDKSVLTTLKQPVNTTPQEKTKSSNFKLSPLAFGIIGLIILVIAIVKIIKKAYEN